MSFSIEYHARSRVHALRLLEVHKSSAPAPVVAFIQQAIAGVASLKEGAARYIHVKAHGHLCDSDGSYSVSNAEISVKPIDIPD